MKTIVVDLSGKVPKITDKYGGEKGEHQFVNLNVIPEAAMQADETIEFYYLLFKVDNGLVASRTYSADEEINCTLWGQLTANRNVVFQLIGTDGDRNGNQTIIAKSPIITLYLGESLEGTVIGIDDNRDSLIAMIGAFNERLDDVEERLVQSDWDQNDPDAPDYIKNKPSGSVQRVDIRGEGVNLNYSYADIAQMWADRVPMSYDELPVVGLYGASNAFFVVVSNFNVNNKGEYKLIEHECFDSSPVARERSSRIYPFAPIHTIRKADGTALTIVSEQVTLPDFALESELENYYTQTEIDNALAEKITLPESASSGDVLKYDGTNDEWTAAPESTRYTEIYDTATASRFTGMELIAMRTAGVPLCYDERPIVASEVDTVKITLFYFNLTDATQERLLKVSVMRNTKEMSTPVQAGYIVTPTIYQQLYGGLIQPDDDGFVTGDQVYDALEEKGDGKYTEILVNPATSAYTGAEILAMWNNKIPMSVGGFPIIAVYTSTDQDTMICHLHKSNEVHNGYIGENSTTYVDNGSGTRYLISQTTLNKLSNGAIVSGNSSFVTGGQVYDAIDAIPDELPSVSSTDNGDVLTVVSGVWAKATPSGAVSPDITVSGTYSYADEFPNQNDILGATYSTTKTLAELLDKVESEGEITIGGFLTRDEDYMTIPSSLKHYAKLKVLASAVASEALVSAMSQMLPGLVTNTKGLLLRVGNTNNGGVTGANIGLIVYQSSSGVAFLAQNQL